MKMLKCAGLVLIAVLLASCSAMQVALEKKDLKVETRMSDTIFLDIENQAERTVFIDIKNTSDKEFDIKPLVISRLQANGYKVTTNPKEAFYILQGNVLYVGQADPSALRAAVAAGYGGTLAGALGGALIGGAAGGGSGALYGAGIGGLVFAGAEMIAGSMVKDVTYTIVTDLMISERSKEAVEQTVQSNLQQGSGSAIRQTSRTTTERKRYQTRIASTANQVNLKLEEALPSLTEGLAKSIAGIL